MTATRASVIVVSRHRATELPLCLLSLAQQDHSAFEIIVVADPAGIAAAQATGLAVRTLPFDEPNISTARNLGLSHAGGAIVAFIDDDAVAEPTWLSRLCAAFENPDVIAATGFIRGRNGISFQWQACEVDAQGLDHPLAPDGALYPGQETRAVKTQGTNCAFGRAVLARIGGFDPALRFYLDEADVNLRLAGLGLTAVVPGAEVHHGFAASDRRRADRLPTNLHEIAASIAVFLRRHTPDSLEQETIPAISRQRTRIDDLVAQRKLGTDAALELNATLATGWDDGMARAPSCLARLPDASSFCPMPTIGPRHGAVLCGRIWQKARLFKRAKSLVSQGQIVTVIILSPTPRAHRMTFTDQGFWLQTGGLFGWSTRQGRRFRLVSFATRITEETARVAPFRPVR